MADTVDASFVEGTADRGAGIYAFAFATESAVSTFYPVAWIRFTVRGLAAFTFVAARMSAVIGPALALKTDFITGTGDPITGIHALAFATFLAPIAAH